jgi:PQQ-dependent catabolism-associated CXXCW motif protein
MRAERWRSLRLSACALSFLALVAGQRAIAADVPEPESYWTGPMQADVPATLARGQVVHTQALADLLARGEIILIDVAERPHRPAALPPETVWKPAAHRDIQGSVWLPGVGSGKLDPALDRFYEAQLAALTKGDSGKTIIVYCHMRCWASWNAAKRAISYGYRNVYWYPDGVEGWLDSGHELAVAADTAAPNTQ